MSKTTEKINLSTEQLLRLTEEGQVTVSVDGDQIVTVNADDLNVSLDQLASGVEARTSSGQVIVY
jgi:hypothetical protein